MTFMKTWMIKINIQMPQPQTTITQQPTTVGNSSNHGKKSIVLYDFAA